jgi:site-specific DNA recombinase
MPQRKPSIHVVGYARVSDSGIALDSTTIESQMKAIQAYCNREGLILEGIYPEAMTAYLKPYKERPVWMSIMDRARKGLIEGVVVTEFSRLSRRQGEQAVIVELLRESKTKVYSVTEDFEDSALGNFMRAAAAFSSESERDKIQYRTTRGMRDRAESGNLTGRGYRTYGYYKADTERYTNGRFIICPEEAEVIVWIFERAVEGWSFRRIAITLTQQKVPTMRGKPAWNYGTIGAILRNPMYTGSRATVYRYMKGENHSIPRPQEEQLPVCEGYVPRIISEELFDRVQQQLVINKAMSVRNNHHPDIGLMRSLAHCAVCHRVMIINHDLDTRYDTHVLRSKYMCKIHTGNPSLDHCVTIQCHLLDTQVWDVVKEYIQNRQLVRTQIAELRRQNTSPVDIDKITGMLDQLRNRYRRIFDLAESAEDDDTYTELKARLQGIEREKRGLESLLKEWDADEEASMEIEKEISRVEAWIDEVRPLITTPDYIPTFADMRSAVLVLGLQASVKPVEEEKRIAVTVSPPSIMRLLSPMSCSPG